MPCCFFKSPRHIPAQVSGPGIRNNFHELKSEATLILSPIRCLPSANKNGRVIDELLQDLSYTPSRLCWCPASHQGWNWPHEDYFATSIFACYECGYLPSNVSTQSSFSYPLLLYHGLFIFLSFFYSPFSACCHFLNTETRFQPEGTPCGDL